MSDSDATVRIPADLMPGQPHRERTPVELIQEADLLLAAAGREARWSSAIGADIIEARAPLARYMQMRTKGYS